MKRFKALFLLIILLFVMTGCQEHTITFVDYDGTIIDEIKLTDDMTAPEVPERQGYTFIGWDHDLANVTNSITITAQYQANEYHIQFMGLEDEMTVLYGDVIETLPTTIKEYHKFIGWTYQDELITLPFIYTYDHDLILEPSYEVGITCKVRFYNADNEVIQISIVEVGNSAIAPSDPLKVGYQFLGWDHSFDVVMDDLHVKPLYRPLEFHVYFDSNPNIDSILVKYDEAITLPNMFRNGHIFEGWLYQESLLSEQLTFNYLEDIHITPQYRVDDSHEMTELESLIDEWINAAQSYRISQILTIKANQIDTIVVQEMNWIPKDDYVESKIYTLGPIDSPIDSHIVMCMESSSLYSYYIIDKPGQTSIYSKEKLTEPIEVDDYEDITSTLLGYTICEKVDHNTFVLTLITTNDDILHETEKIDSVFNPDTDEFMQMIYYFDEASNKLYINLKASYGLELEYEIIIDHYNQVEKIDFQSGAYEEIGTKENPEIISDYSKMTVKTQGRGNDLVFNHYYSVELEEGYYLFDLEKSINEKVEPTYDIFFYPGSNTNIYDRYARVMNDITINQKKVFYVEGGTYTMKLTGGHKYGYSFRFQKLDYVSYADFMNPPQLSNTISGEIEGIFDLNVYQVVIKDSSKTLQISNLSPHIAIACIGQDGIYFFTEWYEGIDTINFDLEVGQNIIIITGDEATSYDLNICIVE